ncbi:MAG: 2Fe-2S iron-sulfur cluster-binding protein [Microbacteriaceae bacterium]|nr:2Fe-2S iron-sulfur cluster-binding protein [Microbacteriaceae bacterium]MCL2795166.1 2Fe-2S iron-sulfur cluster-binding protein [Microbacteriaceae bacterium]
MVKVTFVTQDGAAHEVEAEVGWKLMEVAVNESIPGIYGDCGGQAQCATCHVHVPPEWRPITGERNAAEQAMLANAYDVTEDSRLSCQIIVSEELDGVTVDVVDS